MSAHVLPNEISAKSLFTAVLYSDVPEPSALSSTGERSIYLKQIRREHLARAGMGEVGSQLADATDPKSITKVAQLTERVKHAYSEANGNPADGRWIFLSDLLRLHSTRGGRHWIGTNTSVKAPAAPEHLCIPPKSNEWKQLERKRKEEEDVKSRVQQWITTAEFDPLTPETAMVPELTVDEQIPFTQASLSVSQRPIQTKQTTLKSTYDQANSMNRFGFPVVKRSQVVGKGKGDFGALRRSSSPRIPSQQSHAANDTPHSDPSQQSYPSPTRSIDRSSVHNAKHVSNLKNSQPLHEHNQSEALADYPASQSFLPPSFPTSQIQTLTPRRGTAIEVQDQPTTPFERPLSPPVDVMGIPNPAVGDSHFSEPSGLQDGHSRKRARPPSPSESEPATKRARMSQEANRVSSPPGRHPDVEEMPLTPPNRNLPRLTDLIASAKCQKLSPRKKSCSSKPLLPPVENITETTVIPRQSINHQGDSRKMETTKELTASIGAAHRHSIPDSDPELNPDVRVEVKATPEADVLRPEQIPENVFEDRQMNDNSGRSAPQPDIPPTGDEGPALPEPRPHTPDPPASPTSDPFRSPSVEPGSSRANLEVTSYNLYGLDNLDNPSPTKSLSSLAGSDSDSGSDRENGDTTAGNITVPHDFGFVEHEFNPPFTSTQKPGLEMVKGVTGNFLPKDWLGEKLPSTSQLQAEINSQVDEFDKFMEADLGFDPVAP